MSQDYNNQTIANEIDAIIAKAMAEYAAAKGVDVFEDTIEQRPVEHETPELPEMEEEIQEAIQEIIPENSKSILVEETTSRFSSAIWYDNIKTKRITLAGLGGIGSYVAFLLSRMQPAGIVLYDDDIVESANMSGQLYGINDIGTTKATAIANFMCQYSNFYNALDYRERFTSNSSCTDIAICGFDNMEARTTFFNAWLRHMSDMSMEERKECLFIDGRLAAENFQILCIKGEDDYSISRYSKDFLFSDSEADETICSYKQTSFMANMIGSVMVNLFVNFCANECDPLVPRDLPFYTEYTAETMFFKVIA